MIEYYDVARNSASDAAECAVDRGVDRVDDGCRKRKRRVERGAWVASRGAASGREIVAHVARREVGSNALQQQQSAADGAVADVPVRGTGSLFGRCGVVGDGLLNEARHRLVHEAE